MKLKNFLLFVPLMGTVAAGCSKSEGPEPTQKPDPVQEKWEIKISPSMESLTKATDFGFETGDKIGLYVVNYSGSTAGTLQTSGNHVDNMRFTYSGTWTPDSPIYWLDKETHADFYLYYPYRQISDVSAVAIETSTDQSKEANYKSADFMTGKATNMAPSDDVISISTRHILSRINISLAAGNGFTAETLKNSNIDVKINGILTKANVNLANSQISNLENKSSITPYKYGETYRAIVIPQTVEEGNLITVTVDGRDFNLNKGFTFETNKEHNFTVTLSRTSNGINVNINPWENDGTDNGGVAE